MDKYASMRFIRAGLIAPVLIAVAACGADTDEAVGRWRAEGLSETQLALAEDGAFTVKTARLGMCTGDWVRDGDLIEATCSFGNDTVSTRLRLEDGVLVGDESTDPLTEERRFARAAK